MEKETTSDRNELYASTEQTVEGSKTKKRKRLKERRPRELMRHHSRGDMQYYPPPPYLPSGNGSYPEGPMPSNQGVYPGSSSYTLAGTSPLYDYYSMRVPGGEHWRYAQPGYEMDSYAYSSSMDTVPSSYYQNAYGYNELGYDTRGFPGYGPYPFPSSFSYDGDDGQSRRPPMMFPYPPRLSHPSGIDSNSTSDSDSSSSDLKTKQVPAKKQRRVCTVEHCTKFAQGITRRCTKHGGGKRCTFEGCTKGAVGSTLLCVAHGGGKRCKKERCTKSAIPMYSYCFNHGGGRRCAYAGCSKGARATTSYCIGHGGGKRCRVVHCTKSDQGHGLCIAHGGGRKRRRKRAS